MSGDREAWGGDLTAAPAVLDTTDYRKAAVRIADQVATEHPHPLDDIMPRLSGRLLARQPLITTGVLELLAALGIDHNHARGNHQ